MQADMRVLRLEATEEIVWLDTEPEATEVVVRAHLDMYRIGREVEIDDETGRLGDPLAARARGVRRPRGPARSPPSTPSASYRRDGGVEVLAPWRPTSAST